METIWLESGRGEWNSWCSGEMRRYQEEHPWLRRLSSTVLTLRRESVGSEQDKTYLVLSGGNAIDKTGCIGESPTCPAVPNGTVEVWG